MSAEQRRRRKKGKSECPISFSPSRSTSSATHYRPVLFFPLPELHLCLCVAFLACVSSSSSFPFFLPHRPFCSSQNETRNLETKRRNRRRNACCGFGGLEIGRALDGTALMASKRPPQPQQKEIEKKAPTASHTHTHTHDSRQGIQPVALLQSKALLFFAASLCQKSSSVSLWEEEEEEEERGSYLSPRRRRRSRDVEVPYNKRVSYLSGWRGEGGKRRGRGEGGITPQMRKRRRQCILGWEEEKKRGGEKGMGFGGTNQRFGFSAQGGGDGSPNLFLKSLQRTNEGEGEEEEEETRLGLK